MKYVLSPAAVIVLLLAANSDLQAAQGAVALDGFAATVNGKVITVGDVMEIAAPAEKQLRALHAGEELERRLDEAYRSALNTLIERRLILEDFHAQKLVVPDTMIDDHIREIVAERFNNDRAAMMQALDREQLSYQQWRGQIADRMAVMMLRRREVNARLQVSPTAVREEYERRRAEFAKPAEVQLRMIALNKGSGEDEVQVKRDEAEGLLRKLEAGEDFAELARQHSEGAYAAEGGAWGWVVPGTLREELREAVEKAEVGRATGVIETEGEFYILRVEARKAERLVAFEEVKDQLNQELAAREEARLYRDWMERLRRNHFVKVF